MFAFRNPRSKLDVPCMIMDGGFAALTKEDVMRVWTHSSTVHLGNCPLSESDPLIVSLTTFTFTYFEDIFLLGLMLGICNLALIRSA
jgi:hypothetical protein